MFVAFLILLLFIVAIPFLIVWVAARRRKAMEAAARQFGWTYSAEAPGYAEQFAIYSLFGQGRNRKALNVLTGQRDGVPVEVFDYEHTSHSSASSKKTSHTIVHVDLAALALPTFAAYPETVAEKLAAAVGMQDIDLPEHPVFSGQFVLRGPDEAAVRARFVDPVPDVFSANHGVSAEGGGTHLFVYHEGRLAPPDQLQVLLTEATGIVRAFLASAPHTSGY